MISADTGRVLGIRLGFVGIEFITALTLVRLFGTAAYGGYAYTIVVITLLAIPAAAGFDRMLIKEVAALDARQEWGLLHGILRRATLVVLLVSITLAAAAGLLAAQSVAMLPPGIAPALLVGLCAVPVIAVARIRLAGLQGLGHVAAGQFPEMVLQPVLLLGLAVAIWSVADVTPGAEFLVGLYLTASIVAGIVGMLLWRVRRPWEIRRARPVFRTREWLTASLPFAGIIAFGVALTSFDTIIVGSVLGAESAGVYRLASQMAMLVGFPLTAVNMVHAPRIAALKALGDTDSMQSVASAGVRQVVRLAFPIWLVLVAVGKPLLALFGPEFPPAYASLVILGAAHLAAAAAGIAGYMLIMTGHEKATLRVFAIVVAAGIALCFILVPDFGLEGAAISTGFALIALAVWFAALCRVRLGINTVLHRSRTPDAA